MMTNNELPAFVRDKNKRNLWRREALDKLILNLAVDQLYRIALNTNRKASCLYQCLKYLIAIRHKDYLKKISNNRNCKDSWRNEAMQALTHG